MRRAAVIGSTGQLGSEVVRALMEAGVRQVDPLSHGQIECTDPMSVRGALMELCPDVVVNCAAFVRVDECEDRPEEALRVNALGAFYVARACAELNAICVYISTDYVFDGEKRRPYTEEDPPNPINVYGVSKLAGEHFVRGICAKHFVVRSSGLYGLAGSSAKGGNFVNTVIRLASEGKPIRVVNDQFVAPTYARDLARKIAELLQTEAYGLYHIANAGECSWYQFAGKILELSGLETDFGSTTTAAYGLKAQRPAYSVLAHDRLLKAGLAGLRPWAEALQSYLCSTKPSPSASQGSF